MGIPIHVAASTAAAREPPLNDSTAVADAAADAADAASDVSSGSGATAELEPLKWCHDPFPSAAILVGAADPLPEEYREDDGRTERLAA